jgi:hypothetical protein
MEQNAVSDMNGDVVLADQILSYLSDKHEAGKEARKSGLSEQGQQTTSNNSRGRQRDNEERELLKLLSVVGNGKSAAIR